MEIFNRNSADNTRQTPELGDSQVQNSCSIEPFRQSIFIIVIKFFIVFFLFDLIYSGLTFLLFRIHEMSADFHHYHIFLSLFVFQVIKNSIQLYLIIKIAVDWFGNVYLLNPGEKHLTKKEGVFSIKEKIFDLKTIRSVIVNQSILGKILHYGDIVIKTSASGGYTSNIHLRGIANPQKYEEIFNKCF